MHNATRRSETKSELRVLYKQLMSKKGKSEEYNKMLDSEAYASANIVSFYDAFSTEDGFINVIMEYMNGGSLQDFIKQSGGCPNEDVLYKIAQGMAHGLHELHEMKMIHRDIKPGNVLLSLDGKVKLADFGISKNMDNTKELAQTFVGTFLYMSPERIAGNDYDAKADVWAVGMTMLAVTLGKFPLEILDMKAAYWEMYDRFVTQEDHKMIDKLKEGDTPRSKEYVSFIAGCLAKDPAKRMSTSEMLKHPFLQRAPCERELGKETESLIKSSRENELLEVLESCKEGGLQLSRKKTDFSILSRQLGLSTKQVKDTLCPRKVKAAVSPISDPGTFRERAKSNFTGFAQRTKQSLRRMSTGGA